MNNSLSSLIDAFANLNVLVIGEAMLDSYLEGSTDRLCREAPVPVVAVRDRTHVPGGAANTAVNIRSLGGHAVFLSVVGNDPEWELLQQALEQRGVSTQHILNHPTRRTLAKQRVIAASQLLLRFDQGSTELVDQRTEQALIDHLTHFFPRCDAVLVSDYGYGIVTPRIIQTLKTLQAKSPQVLVVDARNLTAYQAVGATAVKPNYPEAVQLLKIPKLNTVEDRAEQVLQQGDELLRITKAQLVAVTLDTDGALIFQQDQLPYRTYAQPKPDSRAAGAGDTFVSALTLALAAQASIPTMAELASAAAAIVVAKAGTATCDAEELQGYLSVTTKYVSSLSHLVTCVGFYRQQGRRIVFTNGCFDILHRGHVAYLNQAKALGDILIVALNSDDSIRRLKGPTRPINPLEDRVQVLAALSCVDHLIAFEDNTPMPIIQAVRPDVFVKGGDYTRETLPEAALVEALGGMVEILPYLPQHSTTSVIERIQTTTRKNESRTQRHGGTNDYNPMGSGQKYPVH